MTIISTYAWPGQAHLGFEAVERVGKEAKAYGATHVFVLADPGVIAAGLLDPVTASLDAVELTHTLCDRVVPNPDTKSVDAVAETCRASGADLIVALGGGSALDTGKAIRLPLGGGGGVADYALILRSKKRPTPRQLLPMIAIPTTAGTGSEATPWAVLTDLDRQQKYAVGDVHTIPTVALIDPGLMLTLSQFLTAATGMDALSHCIEAYVSTANINPALDPLILRGVELIGSNLRASVVDGSNAAARQAMAEAAMIGGMAIGSNYLGACHALAHQLSSVAGMHHGHACGLMLPHQMEFSLLGALERYAQIGVALGAAENGDLELQAEEGVEVVRSLLADVGLPTRLRDAGVTEDMIPALTGRAIQDLNWQTNPRPVDEADLEKMYRRAF